MWTWLCETAGGAERQGLTPAAETFATREDAETWLSAHYQELREAGVGQVRLMEDGTERYGPLSLMG